MPGRYRIVPNREGAFPAVEFTVEAGRTAVVR
jgi:hypothetical protein